ncbi:hypothetical protein [Amycolatopsis solani]|uniref:hypothetical protein n=1 Tax=Amycolatopsis solani TaxID=3028615 RepID=UPI0025B22329|nr:hypothetical protein [Amycolatopsis sp. MEP2-6]
MRHVIGVAVDQLGDGVEPRPPDPRITCHTMPLPRGPEGRGGQLSCLEQDAAACGGSGVGARLRGDSFGEVLKFFIEGCAAGVLLQQDAEGVRAGGATVYFHVGRTMVRVSLTSHEITGPLAMAKVAEGAQRIYTLLNR